MLFSLYMIGADILAAFQYTVFLFAKNCDRGKVGNDDVLDNYGKFDETYAYVFWLHFFSFVSFFHSFHFYKCCFVFTYNLFWWRCISLVNSFELFTYILQGCFIRIILFLLLFVIAAAAAAAAAVVVVVSF